MERLLATPRAHWQERVASLGFHFHTDGRIPYWDESAYYQFTPAQIADLHNATKTLEALCQEAVASIIAQKRYEGFGLSGLAIDLIEESFARQSPSLYGRFDLAYDGVRPPKLLEYNADTPTALFEAGVVQWEWRASVGVGSGQYNRIHDALIETWKRLNVKERIHFAGFLDYPEDLCTLGYLADTAFQAGHEIGVLHVRDIALRKRFFFGKPTFLDHEGSPITHLYKLYPWEEMCTDAFASHIRSSGVTLYEPAWRMLLQNKHILKVLWEMFPQCPYLLPASSSPQDLEGAFACKPKWGREGLNVQKCERAQALQLPPGQNQDDYVCQAWYDMPLFDGNRPTIGSWVIGGQPAGIGVREDTSLVLGNTGRFLPHCVA